MTIIFPEKEVQADFEQLILRAWREAHGADKGRVHLSWGQDRVVVIIEDAFLKGERLLAQSAEGKAVLEEYVHELLADTEDADLKEKLQRTLENRRKQLAQLQQTANQRQIVELKVEYTLAQLGIIYTQLHSGHYLLKRSSYERLAAEISAEVEGLNDYLSTLHELQQPQLP